MIKTNRKILNHEPRCNPFMFLWTD